MTRALYAGTFDPPTFGHLDLVSRGSRLFDHLVVAIAENSRKEPLLTTDERVELIRANAAEHTNVEVVTFSGLVVDYARTHGIDVLLRGLRTISDFEFEYQMALTNRHLHQEVETVFVMPSHAYSYVSSSLIKDVVRHGGDVSSFVTPAVEAALRGKLAPAVG